jgi:hypothetical protein
MVPWADQRLRGKGNPNSLKVPLNVTISYIKIYIYKRMEINRWMKILSVLDWVWWCTSVIPGTQEAEIGKSWFKESMGKKASKTLS